MAPFAPSTTTWSNLRLPRMSLISARLREETGDFDISSSFTSPPQSGRRVYIFTAASLSTLERGGDSVKRLAISKALARLQKNLQVNPGGAYSPPPFASAPSPS